MLRRKAVPSLEDLAVGSLKRCQGYKNNACGVDNIKRCQGYKNNAFGVDIMISRNIETYENRLLIMEKFW